IGVTPGPHAEIAEEVRRIAAARGLAIEVRRFDDPARIDAALAAGRLDAASFEDAHEASLRMVRKPICEAARSASWLSRDEAR
ncbi:metal ABC transporter substrate-binding protein, partial [Burkholderia sp. Cy-647]|nr:metal ABC transporter substrate-binding protein [Burkholderia sp. Cy-647]